MKIFFYIAILASASFAQGSDPPSQQASTLIDARDHLGTIQSYIVGRERNLVMRDKSHCMFGCPQDPAKAKRAQQSNRVTGVQKKTELPLQEIVDALPVTMIDTLGDRVVMTGAPPFSKGQTLELDYKGEKVVLIFEGSRSTGAYFRDAKTKKLKAHQISRLAKGITQGAPKRSFAGGIHKEGSDGPKKITLDFTNSGGPPPN